MNKFDKWSVLAGVRFLLAAVVAIKHLDDYVALGWMRFVAGFGPFEAICGFLLISGYSICTSYAQHPEGFFRRRLARLYPIYLGAIALTYLTFLVLKVAPPGIFTIVINALFLNQLVTTTSVVGPAWTLSLEFWLYCTIPFLIVLSQRQMRLIVFGSFAAYVAYTISRTLFHMPFYSGVGYGANLVFLSFIWVAGVRLARAGKEDKTAMRDIALIFGGQLLLAATIQFGFRMKHHALGSYFGSDVWSYAQEALTLLFVYYVFQRWVITKDQGRKRSRLLRWLGDISYPLYLMHGAVYALLAHWGVESPVLIFAAAVAVSAASYWLLDFYSQKRLRAGAQIPPIAPLPEAAGS